MYTLRISARDNGSPRLEEFLTLTVYIADVNDNRPAFDHPVYTAEIFENEPINTSLITLTATDRDIGKCKGCEGIYGRYGGSLCIGMG